MYMFKNLVDFNYCKKLICNLIFVLILQFEFFFLSFVLYDVKEGKKILEDFYIDLNEFEIKKMILDEVLCVLDKFNIVEGKNFVLYFFNLFEEWLFKKDRYVRYYFIFVQKYCTVEVLCESYFL